jgi:hypothetical protein
MAFLLYGIKKSRRQKNAWLNDDDYVAQLANRLRIYEDGFKVKHHHFVWNDITRITVAQEPQEKVRFTFQFEAGLPGQSIKINEELSSFEKTFMALETHYQFPPQWRQEFRYVVGRTKEITLYDKAKMHQTE